MQQRVILIGREVGFGRRQFEDGDAIERPAVRARHRAQFFGGFRKRDVQALFSGARAFQHELERQRGFAGSRIAFQKIDAVRIEPSEQHLVQTLDANR